MPRVDLELRRDGEQYVGRCWQEEDRQDPARLSNLRLGPADTVAIPDPDPPHTPRPYLLQELVDAPIRFHPKILQAVFEERGQVTLGKYLWNETLGKLDRYAAVSDVDLRILTDGEQLERGMGDLADALRTARRPPWIVYVNCCQGTSADWSAPGGS